MSGGLPAKGRPGRQAWLGPIALGTGLVSWLVPGGIPVALVAVACGVWSVRTRGPYRIDGTAVAGAVAGGLQVLLSLLLVAADAAGH